MSNINYTQYVPWPPAVTSGTTVQSYQDPTGEIWVAKNGVNNGNWVRARDALYCLCYRSAAANTPAINTVFTYDTAADDVWGMFVSPGITTPIAGTWLVGAGIGITPTAATDYIAFYMIVTNGGAGGTIRSTSAGTNSSLNPFRATSTNMFHQSAPGAIQITTEFTTPSRVIQTGIPWSFLWAKYVSAY